MKVLIVGASGLVGSNCLHRFKAHTNWDVVGTYYSYAAKDTVFYDTLQADNPKNFNVDDFAPDVVLHCGALTHVDHCELNPMESHMKTVQSTMNVIEICERHNARMVFISTDYIFDGEDGPYDENAEPCPLNAYGHHKLEAEDLVKKHIPHHLILRITNVYGDEERGKNFVSRILSQIFAGERLTLKLPTDQYATPVNAADIAHALEMLIKDRKDGTYNISSTDYMSRVQLWQRILHHFPDTRYDLQTFTSDELNQPAARPLQGGLKNKKFMKEYPSFCFTTVDDYLTAKQTT